MGQPSHGRPYCRTPYSGRARQQLRLAIAAGRAAEVVLHHAYPRGPERAEHDIHQVAGLIPDSVESHHAQDAKKSKSDSDRQDTWNAVSDRDLPRARAFAVAFGNFLQFLEVLKPPLRQFGLKLTLRLPQRQHLFRSCAGNGRGDRVLACVRFHSQSFSNHAGGESPERSAEVCSRGDKGEGFSHESENVRHFPSPLRESFFVNLALAPPEIENAPD